MNFPIKTCHVVNHSLEKDLTIEPIDENTALRFILESDISNASDKRASMAIELPREVVRCIRDYLNTYLDEGDK